MSASPPHGSAVFWAGLAGIACYRIPSVIQVPYSGALLALAEARRNSCNDGAAHEIASRRSLDGGRTWGDVAFIMGNESYYVGNPTVVAAYSGRLCLLVALHTPKCAGDCEVGNAISTSEDGGVSWSRPREITAALGAAGKARTGPGIGLLLTPPSKYAGRLLIPASTGMYGNDHAYISDDAGETWRAPAQPTLGPGFDESQLAMLSDGSVLIIMRHAAEGYKGKAIARSTDGGETWSNVSYASELKSPVCQASIASLRPRSGAPLSLFYSGDNSTSHTRERLTILRSDDDGKSWRRHLLIDAGPSAYSCLVAQPLARGGGCPCARGNESCAPCGGVLYEAAQQVMRFARFPLAL